MTRLDQTVTQQGPDTLNVTSDGSNDGDSGVNVGQTERWISGAAGALCAAAGLSRKSPAGLALAAVGGALLYRGVAGHCPMYRGLGISTSDRPAEPEDYFERGIHVAQAMTIQKSPQELYQYWRDFANLPRIMTHLEGVNVIDDRRSHWVAKTPSIAGGKIEWDAEIINDEPDALIAWRSLQGADVDNAGSVRFLPALGDRGTEVKVVIDYIPPGGQIGRIVAKLFGEDPQHQIREDLRNFKRVMECGEVPTIVGQPRGTCGRDGGTREQE